MGLPVGYGFELTDLRYQHAGRIFVAELQIAQQYMGDVTAYQEEIQILNNTIQDHKAMVEQQANQMVAMVSDMEQAYKEGVESNG